MFSKIASSLLITALVGLNAVLSTAQSIEIPDCQLDKSELKMGWFVQVGDIGRVEAVKHRLPPGAKLRICQTTWFKNSNNYKDVVIEVGKFTNRANAKSFGQRIQKEVTKNVVVNSGPPSGL
ncbi:MAG: hypothetical protein WBB28_20895 [Crinalium sp.]